MLQIRYEGAVVFRNEHRNIALNMNGVTHVEEDGDDPLVESLQQRADALGEMLYQEARQGHRLCLTGASWSQSELFQSFASQIVTERDSAIWEIPADALDAGVTTPANRFVMVAAGTRIATLVNWLEVRGFSLRTAGSHNGQSVAGMFATGAHGSALEESGFESHVRGMLIAGGRDRSFWIEDPQNKVLSDNFIAQFAEHGPHQHFLDALIHLGGLGLVNAVLLEVVPEFLLGSVQTVAPLPSDCLAQLSLGNFADAMDHLREGHDPFFYELTFDPFRADGDVSQIAYVHCPSGTPRAMTEPQTLDPLDIIKEESGSGHSESQFKRLDDDGYEGLIDIGQMLMNSMAAEAHSAPTGGWPLKRLLKTWDPRKIGPFRINPYNAAFAVPLHELERVLDIGFAAAQNYRRHFVYTVRFAKKSQASLSFLRWDRCAIINVDGLEKRFSRQADRAAKAFVAALEDAGIPYSMHWGKDAPSDEAKIDADFGPAVDGWQSVRDTVLDRRVKHRLRSPALKDWGLI